MSDRILSGQRTSFWEIGGAFLLGAIAVTLLAVQCASLYRFPQPDAGRWYGDETWQMREFQTQVQTGVLRDPDAPASSIYHHNGIVPNSLWLDAMVFGGAEALLFPNYSTVAIGRTVTFAFALVLLAFFYYGLRKWELPPWLALAGVVALAANRDFFYASHSARYDLWTALGVLIGIVLLANAWNKVRHQRKPDRGRHYFLMLFPALTLAWNFHVVRILWLPFVALVVLYFSINRGMAIRLLVGNGIAAIALLLPSILILHSHHLFHYGSEPSMLGLTFGDLPLVRPFTDRLLRMTVVERFLSLQSEAPVALYLAVGAVVLSAALLAFQRVRLRSGSRSRSGLLLLTALAIASWALTLRDMRYYDIQILPAIVFTALVLGYTVMRDSGIVTKRVGIIMLLALVAIAAGLSFRDASVAGQRSRILANDLERVTSTVKSDIQAHALGGRPVVLAELQLQDYLLTDPRLRTINALFREYPDTPMTLPQFLAREHVDFIFTAKRSSIFTDLAGKQPLEDSLLRNASEFHGHFSDAGFDYFGSEPAPEDTLVLYPVPNP